MHGAGKCSVRVRHRQREVNAPQLVQLGQTEDVLELQFENDVGEVRDITFHPNRDLAGSRSPASQEALVGCHLEGVSEGEHSALSVCSLSQLGGIITINKKRYILQAGPSGVFTLSPLQSDECEWGIRRKRDTEAPHAAEYYSAYLDNEWRYVEFVLVADYSVFVKYDKNATAVHERLHSIANYVNSLYFPLNIRVILVWADVWTTSDLIEVSSNSDRTLSNFLEFRKDLIKPHPHDNAHLLTDVRFENSVVGKAYKGTMCSYDYSGGVDMDHNREAAFVAATVAHEMGHNFGMDHDGSYTDCRCPTRSCIMAPSTGTISPTFWSECSLKYLQHSISRGVDYCLRNVPSTAFGGARCGNGIVEADEDCDCGTLSSCANKCCNPKTCKLAENAQCASGKCCNLDTCQVKPAATRCRDATNSCDLPEFCDGQMEHCPADFYVQDGLRCPDHPTDFCYNGNCGSRDAHCKFIWGPTGSNAATACYELNSQGSYAGNCGYEQQKNTFLRCDKRDIRCGRLHCIHENEKLAFGDPSTVSSAYTALRLASGGEVACRVVWTKYVGGGKDLDLGMVPDGASCGEDKICVDAKCQNRTEKVKMATKCDPESCNGAGICNNMGNCHCIPGYGGTGCGIPGPGGSVNSGPATERGVIHVGYVVFWLLFAMFICFIIASVFMKRKKNVWLHKQIWARIKKLLNIQRLLVPIRKAPPPPGPAIRTAELNAVWGDSPSDALRSHRPSPPMFSPPIIPSGSYPPSAQPSVVRSASYRPKEAPPKIPLRPDQKSLKELYAERSGELGIGDVHAAAVIANDERTYATPPADDYRPQLQKISRSESTNRPVNPPPPPPHAQLPVNSKNKEKNDHSSGISTTAVKKKPSLPTKPVVAAKPKVKDIAARFDPKSSGLSTKFT